MASPAQQAHVQSVERALLYTPPLEELAKQLEAVLLKHFRHASVTVVDCPDLQNQWGLAAPGICGSPRLVDVGGTPNLFQPARRGARWTLRDIAEKVHLPGAYIIGACAASSRLVGRNAELMPCEHTHSGNRVTQCALVDDSTGSYRLDNYDSDEFGLLANLFASRGQQGKVLKVMAEGRVTDTNFVTCMREGLAAEVKDPLHHIGLGGVFKVTKGTVKAHVMPDFPAGELHDGPEVQSWLKFYSMGPDLVCLSTFLTGDPTGDKLNLRLEHTHFFNTSNGQGGHFHHSDTPDTAAFEGYFTPAEYVYRVDNAFKARSAL